MPCTVAFLEGWEKLLISDRAIDCRRHPKRLPQGQWSLAQLCKYRVPTSILVGATRRRLLLAGVESHR